MSIPKRIFLSSSIALAVILLFWGIYALSFKKAPAEKSAPADNTQTDVPAVAPAAKDSQIVSVSDEAVLAPILSADGNSIKYYSKSTGKAYQMDLDGTNKKVLSDKELIDLSDIAWSPDKAKVISEFSAATDHPKFFFYDYSQNKGVQLKNNLDNVVWAQDNKIFYKYFDAKTKERTLNVADPDGSNWKKITDISLRDISIAPIPKTGLVSFWNKPDSFTETLMQSAPVLGGERKDISKGKFGTDYLWSMDGNNLLESSVDKQGGSKLQLGIANSLGGEYKNLGIPTLASKCVWSKTNKIIYYALPGSIPDGTILPNDYINNKFNTSDTFWKVDIATGEKSRIIDLAKINTAYDAANLFLNSDESSLFFINKIDGKLYKMSL